MRGMTGRLRIARWAVVTAVVALAAVGPLASIVFFTMFVWLLWIVITSLLLFARSRQGGTQVA